MNGFYAEFEEEVLAEDGEVEEYFGYDLPAVYVDSKLWLIDFIVYVIHHNLYHLACPEKTVFQCSAIRFDAIMLLLLNKCLPVVP